MWTRVFDRVLVPILFVLVGVYAASRLVINEDNRSVALKKAEEEKMKKMEVEPIVEKAEHTITISAYDEMFKEVATKYNLDWMLLAAIAKAESGFRHDAISRAGAVGLMQIMPQVAKNLGYSRAQLFDPYTNIDLAAQLLQANEKILHLPKELNEKERWKFTLGCYNAGYTRIVDARALADHFGSNADRWNNVALCLGWLSDPEFSEHKVVKSGAFHGSRETTGYVNKVMHIYDQYSAKIIHF